MAISDFIPGVDEVKMIFAIVIFAGIVGAGAYVWNMHSEIETLKTNNATLTSNNKVLQENNDVIKSNLTTAQAANATNSATIAQLLKERQDDITAVNNLAAQKKASDAVVTGLNQKLKTLSKNPANDGSISPDLREIIRSIQTGSAK